jgi:magnesium transporter
VSERQRLEDIIEALEIALGELGQHEKLDKEAALQTLSRIKAYLWRDKGFAEKVAKMTFWQRAFHRLPSLIATLLLELGVVFILKQHDETVAKAAAFVGFMPVVSAIAGNYGLQCGVIVTRALAVGTLKDFMVEVFKELGSALMVGLIVGVFSSLMAALLLANLKAAFVVGLSMLAAITTASLSGTVLPYLFSRLNIDPALIAGPAECTVQDLIGFFTYVTLLRLFFG